MCKPDSTKEGTAMVSERQNLEYLRRRRGWRVKRRDLGLHVRVVDMSETGELHLRTRSGHLLLTAAWNRRGNTMGHII
jgi:hypothetical protein